jgi:basic membrane protein A and related proteins
MVVGFRRIAPLLAGVLVLFACITMTARAGSEQDRPRVVLVTFPCSHANLICAPFERALRRTGTSGRIVSPDFREDQVATLSLLTRQGFDLVVVDFNFIETLGKVAPRFPKTSFGLLDVPVTEVPGRPRNVQALIVRTHEASYLAGWLAARLEQRRDGKDVVGAVGGFPIDQVNDFIVGFRAGAKRGAPGITVLTGYSRDFADPNKCEAIARRQIARGAGAVFNVAGACGLGTLRAAKRAGVWAIGVDRDQSGLGPHVLTSVVKRFDAVFLALLRDVQAGRRPTGGTREFHLRHGASGLGRINPKVPATLRAELERVRSRIVAGRIRVPGIRYG